MKGKFLATISGTAMVLAAGVALAGTPLENPPFTNGGFVPPNKDVLKAETASGNIVTKYAGATTKCDQKLVVALNKAGIDLGKIADANTKWNDCKTKAQTKYNDGVIKQIGKGKNPACLQALDINAIKSGIDSTIGTANLILYCDGPADPMSGFNVPTTSDFAKGETAVGAAAVKAGSAVAKCFNKAADGDFKGAVDQAKFNDCILKANTKGADAVNKQVAKGTLPPCLTPAIALGVVAIGVTAGGDYTDETFCGSPSGAFIDGAASF